MKTFYTTIKFEGTTFEKKMPVTADGKEQAIDIALERLFKTDFRAYMNVSKVEVIEGLS